MKVDYRKELDKDYLVFCQKEVDTSSYQIRMILGNTMKNLLPCRIQILDGEYYYYYEITGKKSVSDYYNDKKIEREELLYIFRGIIKGIEESREYLLEEDKLILEPEFIYWKPEEKAVHICWYPGYEGKEENRFQSLMEYFLPRLNHQKQETVALGYELYRRILGKNLDILQLKELFFQAEFSNQNEETETEGKNQNSGRQVEVQKSKGVFVKEKSAIKKINWDIEKPSDRPYQLKECLKAVGIGSIFGGVCLAVVVLQSLGYFSVISITRILGIVLGLSSVGMLVWRGIRKRKQVVQREEKKRDNYQQIREITGETCILNEQDRGRLETIPKGRGVDIGISEDFMILGKMKGTADACIDYPTVSRVHAQIRRKNNRYYLTDLNSTNGTFLNGVKLKAKEEREIFNGDQIYFADVGYRFLTGREGVSECEIIES